MKIISRPGIFNAQLLSEQIAAAFPEFFETRPSGRFARYTLDYDGFVLTLRVPDDADLTKLQAVAAAHNPDDDSILQAEEKERVSLRQGIIDKFLALGFTKQELKYIRDVLS